MGGRKWFERLNANHWLAELMALIGGIVYFIQSWIYAHTQVSVLDEGLYLLKGVLFATGQYRPFQDYGPWTNHMPLSFLIPGYIQVWFGYGLRTGRYLAIGLGILFLIGFWLVVRRFGGRWWAAAAIWVVALNPAVIKIYSVMTSQVLVICMLMWVFVLTLGKDRKPWQVILGTALAGLLPLTRLNIVPLLPLLVIYIFWEHGMMRGGWAFVTGLFTFGLGHALFWPEILKLWASWLPSSVTPFLDGWRRAKGGDPVWNPGVSFDGRLVSFFDGIHVHFVSIMGFVTALFLWFGKKGGKRKIKEFKAIVFLSILFAIMFILHAWAALFKDYCVFCFSPYLSFFSYTGFLVMALLLSTWDNGASIRRQKWMWVVVLFFSLGIGYSANRMIGSYHFLDPLVETISSIAVPRMKDGQFLDGKITLIDILANKFGWNYFDVLDILRQAQQVIHLISLAIMGVLGTWLLLLGFRKLETCEWYRAMTNKKIPVSNSILFAFLVFGWFLSPISFFAGSRNTYDCKQDNIASYELNGAHLAENIPPGSKVYWRGGSALSVLLYLPDAEFFPAQFNIDYSYRKGGDPDELVKYGLWNDELARHWAKDADYIIIAEHAHSGWLAEYVENGSFTEVAPTAPLNPCQTDTRIHIYRRLP